MAMRLERDQFCADCGVRLGHGDEYKCDACWLAGELGAGGWFVRAGAPSNEELWGEPESMQWDMVLNRADERGRVVNFEA